MIRIAPTTAEDCERVFGERPHLRIRAQTAHLDGEPVAIAGLAYAPDGTAIACLRGHDVVKRFPKTIHKAVLQGLADARARGVRRIVALCDERIEAAPRWLARLGFRPTHEPNVWVWEV